jgi:PAS domain S-box-containing protein
MNWSMQSTAQRIRRWTVLPWTVLFIGIPVSIVLYVVLGHAVENVARWRFERQASEAKGLIEVRIHFYADILYGLRALFATQDTVTRAEFHRFVKSLDLKHRYPGFDLVNFAAYVPGYDRRRFEEAVRHDKSVDPNGYPQFAIKPSGERADYHVMVYLEPMADFAFAFGLDLAANPALAAAPQTLVALQHAARDSGRLTASGIPIRVKAAQEYVGLAMRLAVYRAGMPVETVEQRRAAYVGSVGAGFNVNHLMKGALDEGMARYMRFRLYDVGPTTEPVTTGSAENARLLFDSDAPKQSASSKASYDDPPTVFTSDLPMEVGGRIWRIHFSTPKNAIIERVDALLPWVVLIGGVLSSLLLSALFNSLASSRSRAMRIAQDITKDLRQSEASLAAAQRMAHLGNWSFDPSTRLVEWSAETYRIFGLTPSSEPMPFTEFLQRIHEDDQHLAKETLLGAMAAREQREIEHRIYAADGTIRWVHTIVQATSSEAHAPVPGTIMDITERKLAEQELLESRALLLDAQKLAQVGCCHYNVLDRRMIWSEELYRIHGVDPDAFLPTHDSTMQLVHPEDRAAWQDTLAHALHDGKPFTREFRIVRRDASVRHLRSLGEVIKDAAGRPARMLWSVLDITEQKQTEHALRTSAEQLTALSRRLVEVQEAERRQLSRELHDRVGQNLTALSINLDILRTGLSGDECAEHRLRLSDSTALLESTVDTIEDVMAELRPPMLDDYGLLPALHWYARDFSKRTGIEVDVDGKDVERPAPELEITLFRIAQEALNNVAKHARAKWVQIELDHVNGHSVMTVTDNGIGIDGARRERTGLGMVTMRERTQAVGGIFRVRRGPGGGTQIAVEISRHGNTHTHRG